jgi:hypothetical protein
MPGEPILFILYEISNNVNHLWFMLLNLQINFKAAYTTQASNIFFKVFSAIPNDKAIFLLLAAPSFLPLMSSNSP